MPCGSREDRWPAISPSMVQPCVRRGTTMWAQSNYSQPSAPHAPHARNLKRGPRRCAVAQHHHAHLTAARRWRQRTAPSLRPKRALHMRGQYETAMYEKSERRRSIRIADSAPGNPGGCRRLLQTITLPWTTCPQNTRSHSNIPQSVTPTCSRTLCWRGLGPGER